MRKNKIAAAYILGTLLTIIIPGLVSRACKLPVPAHLSTFSETENGKDDAAKLFEGYPKSRSFDYFVKSHLNSEQHLNEKHLLYGTWFVSENVAMENIANVRGTVSYYTNMYNWATRGGKTYTLNESQLIELNKTLLDLPESTIHPPIKHLLIFSFCMKGKWITRTYDTSALPKSILQIYAITAAPLPRDKKD